MALFFSHTRHWFQISSTHAIMFIKFSPIFFVWLYLWYRVWTSSRLNARLISSPWRTRWINSADVGRRMHYERNSIVDLLRSASYKNALELKLLLQEMDFYLPQSPINIFFKNRASDLWNVILYERTLVNYIQIENDKVGIVSFFFTWLEKY